MAQEISQTSKKEKYKHGIKIEKASKKKIRKKDLLARIEFLESKLLAATCCPEDSDSTCKGTA